MKLGALFKGNARALAVPTLIWFGLQFSQGVYFAVLVQTVNRFNSQPRPIAPPLALGYFKVMALVETLFAIGLPFVMAQYKSRQLIKAQVGELPLGTLVQKFAAIYLVRLALLESIAVLGLVVGTKSHSVEACYGYFAVSFIGFMISFPSENFFRRWMAGRFN